MIVALYILLSLVVVGLALYLMDRRRGGSEEVSGDTEVRPDGEGVGGSGDKCCGLHLTCERDSLLTALADKVEYYEDEELDAYAGRGADDYGEDEIEEFRDVLLTLRPDDIAGWARSVQLRGITLPSPVKDELLLIVAEARAALVTNANH